MKMQQLDSSILILLILAIVCYLTRNNTVMIAIFILLVFKLTPLNVYFPVLQKQGLSIGIIVLTAAVLVPLANGTISFPEIVKSFTDWKALCAIFMGIFVSYAGMRGIGVLSSSPSISTGLILGTIIGVAGFKGVPVGPLIAAGLLSFFISK